MIKARSFFLAKLHVLFDPGTRLGTKLPDWIVRKALDVLVERRELEEAEMMAEVK